MKMTVNNNVQDSVFSLYIVEESANSSKGVFTNCITAITEAVKLLKSEFHADCYVIYRNVPDKTPIVTEDALDAGDKVVHVEAVNNREAIIITLTPKCLKENLVVKSNLADELFKIKYFGQFGPDNPRGGCVVKLHKFVIEDQKSR